LTPAELGGIAAEHLDHPPGAISVIPEKYVR
jgi:hypothetical protein